MEQTDNAPLKAVIVPVTPFQQNCSILWCTQTKKAAVVDPGGELDRIIAAADKNGVTIDRIFVTHGHLDHAAAVSDLAARLDVPVEGPEEADSFWIDKMADQAAKWGFPPSQPFVPNRWLRHGDRVTLGALTFDVIHCPGHTPGHVVFYHAPSRFAVVGDVLFRGSIGRTDFPMGDHQALIRSIREQLFPLGDDVTFVPGHGELSTFGWERKTNPFVSDLAVGA